MTNNVDQKFRNEDDGKLTWLITEAELDLALADSQDLAEYFSRSYPGVEHEKVDYLECYCSVCDDYVWPNHVFCDCCGRCYEAETPCQQH